MQLNERDALVVVDLQLDFLPGGPLPVPGGNEIVEPIVELTERFSTVVASQDFHPRGHVSFASSHAGRKPGEVISVHGQEQVLWPDHCVIGSQGARLLLTLSDTSVSLILRKGMRREVDSYSAFRENKGAPAEEEERRSTGLCGWLHERKVTRLFIVGLARDYCVKATALDGVAAGFEIWIIDDLTRAMASERTAELNAVLAAAGVAHTTWEKLEAIISGPGRRTRPTGAPNTDLQ